MLRYVEVGSFDHLVVEGIAESLNGLPDHLKRASVVVLEYVPDIFEEECGGLLFFDNFSNVKEEVPPVVGEALFVAGLAEWLTRETCTQNLEIGNAGGRDLGNILNKPTLQEEIGADVLEVVLVGRPGMLIPFGRKNALRPAIVESEVKSSDARKKVDDPDGLIVHCVIFAHLGTCCNWCF